MISSKSFISNLSFRRCPQAVQSAMERSRT
nr:MAG TPA: hypothetical protein [Caudoviricetes sp.]